MHVDLQYNELVDQSLEQLSKGAFLTTKRKDEVNTMTIAWGNVGYIWRKPVFIAYVRYSRHTYRMVDETKEFTISIPLENNLNEALRICGTKSGRDIDKFKECKLTKIDGRVVDVPIIGECERHYECKVIYQQTMEPALIPENIKDDFYKSDDYHVMYFGEIVDSYLYKND